MIDYIKLVFALLFPAIFGFVIVSSFKTEKSALSDGEKLALSFLVGIGALSLEMLLLGVLRIKLILPNILAGAAIIMVLPLYLSIKNKSFSLDIKSWIKFERLKWYELLPLMLILTRTAFVLFEDLVKPVVSVDAFANWSFRAKVFFFDSGLLLNPKSSYFLGGGAVFYPLNIPLAETWIFNVLGYWNDELIKIIFALFFAALLILFYGAAKRASSRPIALFSTYLLSTLPFLVHHATIEYADFPLCVYFTAAALLLLDYFETNNNKYLYLSALLAGIGSWTKSEGMPLLIVNLIVLGIFYVHSKKEKIASAKNLLIYFLIAFIFKLPWSIINFVYHIPKNIYQRIEYEKAFDNLYRLPVIINYFYNKMFFYGNWNIAWFVLIIVVIFSFSRLKNVRSAYSLFYICFLLFIFSFMYYITENYTWLLDGTTLNRNMLLIMPLAIYFIAVNLPGFFSLPAPKLKPKQRKK